MPFATVEHGEVGCRGRKQILFGTVTAMEPREPGMILGFEVVEIAREGFGVVDPVRVTPTQNLQSGQVLFLDRRIIAQTVALLLLVVESLGRDAGQNAIQIGTATIGAHAFVVGQSGSSVCQRGFFGADLGRRREKP